MMSIQDFLMYSVAFGICAMLSVMMATAAVVETCQWLVKTFLAAYKQDRAETLTITGLTCFTVTTFTLFAVLV